MPSTPSYEQLLQENIALRTRLQQVEAALRQSEDHFDQIMQNMTGIFWIGAPTMEKGLVYVSPRFETVFGASFDEIVDEDGMILKVIHPDDRAVYLHSQRELFEKGGRDLEYRIIRPDGEMRYLRSRAFKIFNTELQQHQHAGITEDITEQKFIENALRETNQRLELSIQSAQLGTWEWDIVTNELKINTQWAAMLGYTLKELSPPHITTWGARVHPDDHEKVLKNLNAYTEGLMPLYQVEHRLRMKNGEWLWVLTCGQIMGFGINNEPLKMAGIHLDISQRKNAENQAFQLEAERQRVQILSDFIRDTSHDLKTPISLLSTGMYLLRKITDVDQRAARITILEKHLRYLIDVIEQMQKMATLDSISELKLKPQPVSILLDELATNSRRRAESKGLRFNYDNLDRLPKVAMDVDHLFQALTNLIDNALQFTPQAGLIGLHARLDAHEIIIEITNTGAGIDSATLPRVFERFYKGDAARAYGTGGAGLGLPMTKRIVELHHGHIEAESIPNQMTTFRLVLPIVTSP
jgi:PAS domain S-box-containing protein